ncbi:MAG: aldo/keto reductase [Acidobacteriota bacterium]
MKHPEAWNRRDFITRPVAFLAASRLLGNSETLFGQPVNAEPAAPGEKIFAKPICRPLGKTGITLPIVSMGVMNADVPGLIPRSYEIGVRHFDTAEHYQQGRNEEMVGSMIKQMGVREKVIISTKILPPGWSGRGPKQATIYTAAEVKQHFLDTFDGSLKRLQMDHVDILYNHAADTEAAIRSDGTLEAMTDLKKAGKARFLGVSSHQPVLVLEQAMRLGVYDVVLIPFNYTMAADRELLRTIDAAARKGIGIVAMKTQAGGAMRPDPRLGKPLKPASQTALLKWALRHESIATAIPGYTTYDQMEQNFSVAPSLSYTRAEEEFLSDSRAVSEAQFCHQCGQCRPDCPRGVDIPELMRSHMYAVQYANYALAAQTMGSIAAGKGLSACVGCDSCLATCRNAVNIAMKIQHLKEIALIG